MYGVLLRDLQRASADKRGTSVYVSELRAVIYLSELRLASNCDRLWSFSRAAEIAGHQIILQDNKRLPFVSIRVLDPGLILNSITTVCLHFVARQ